MYETQPRLGSFLGYLAVAVIAATAISFIIPEKGNNTLADARVKTAIAQAAPFCGKPDPNDTNFRHCFAMVGGGHATGILIGVNQNGIYQVLRRGEYMASELVPWIVKTHLYAIDSQDGKRIAEQFKTGK